MMSNFVNFGNSTGLYPNKQIVHNIRVEFPQLQNKTKASVWAAQMTQLPSFTLNQSQYANGPWMMSSIPAASVTFEPISVHFLLDENWDVYEELYKWALGEGNYITGESEEVTVIPRDMLIHILDNKNEKIVMTFRFSQAFPQIFGNVDFDYTDENSTYNKLNVQFQYKWFTIEKNNQTVTKMKFKNKVS